MSSQPTSSSYLIAGTTFILPQTYRAQHYVGRGASGVVCSALDHRSQKSVAIKKLGDVFDTDSLAAKRTLREIRLLRHFKHENVLNLRDVCCSVTDGAVDLYIVTELMATSLDRVIRSSQALSEQHCQYFAFQLLSGVSYLHSCSVLHRDLKPSNLLVNEDCALKITDFGLARGVDPADCLDCLTEYVVTRWYRAPELVLCSTAYTKAVDLWSVGCILAELLARKPLFRGSNPLHQLSTIIDVLGSPHAAQLAHVPPHAARYVSTLAHRHPTPLRSLFPAASEDALGLLGALLVWQPGARPSADAALGHAFLGGFADADDAPAAPFDFERVLDPAAEPRRALARELCQVRPALAPLLHAHLEPHAAAPPPRAAYNSWPADGRAHGRGGAEAAKLCAEESARRVGGRAARDAEEAKRQATTLAKLVGEERATHHRAALPGRAVRSRVAWIPAAA